MRSGSSKAGFPDVPSLWQLAQAILTCLKIVWIPLDEQKDDAQAIFESLNDKGMPLRASELLCNYLFRPIMEAKENSEELHNTQWLATIQLLDDDDQFEEYLRHLISIGETKMLGKNRKVYVHFKGKNRKPDLRVSQAMPCGHFRLVLLYTERSRTRSRIHINMKRINQLLIAIGNTRMESSTPFVLSVLQAQAKETISDDSTCAILRETLVLLVRRKMTELATTLYDVMFPSLLGKIVNEPNPVKALHERFKYHAVWISDQEFEEAVKNKPAYRRNDLAFSRMLLIEIDKRLQTHGQFPDYSTVGTIEHMIPQTLDGQWKTYLGAEADDDHLPVVVDTIGNLCLLSGPANSSAGQDPFESKKAKYSPLTALARQIKEHKRRWDMTSVRERSQTLAKEALGIWTWANA